MHTSLRPCVCLHMRTCLEVCAQRCMQVRANGMVGGIIRDMATSMCNCMMDGACCYLGPLHNADPDVDPNEEYVMIATMVVWLVCGYLRLYIGSISASPTACLLRGMGVPVLKMTACVGCARVYAHVCTRMYTHVCARVYAHVRYTWPLQQFGLDRQRCETQ